jgi:hypothetical protein
MSEAAFNASANTAEMERQGNFLAAETSGNFNKATESALHHYRAKVLLAAATNSMSAPNVLSAIEQGPSRPQEAISRSDNTAFNLYGGRYVIAVAATWNDTGTVTLTDPNGAAIAVWSADGSKTLDLRYGEGWTFAIDTATGVTATVETGAYVASNGAEF